MTLFAIDDDISTCYNISTVDEEEEICHQHEFKTMLQENLEIDKNFLLNDFNVNEDDYTIKTREIDVSESDIFFSNNEDNFCERYEQVERFDSFHSGKTNPEIFVDNLQQRNKHICKIEFCKYLTSHPSSFLPIEDALCVIPTTNF